MACGYGACYGCAVEIDGELKRLCVEGPVLHAPLRGGTHGSPTSPLLRRSPQRAGTSVQRERGLAARANGRSLNGGEK